MPILEHYKAIRCIELRIQELHKEIELSNKIMDEPKTLSDYHFAKTDKQNFESEINQLRNTIKHLTE